MKSFHSIGMSILLVVFCIGCQSIPGKITPQKFTGHYTTGIAYAFFTPDNSDKHYLINLPEWVVAYKNKLPSQKIGNEEFETVYVELEGVIIPYNDEWSQISVTKVISVGPPHKEYLERERP